MKVKTAFKIGVISEIVVLLVGLLIAWTNDGKLNTFDFDVFELVLCLNVLLIVALAIRLSGHIEKE